jgi:cob(I)alamin adenosyltransferase
MGMSLRYAFDAPVEIGKYTLMGSALRALGKGWRILVIGDENLHEELSVLKAKLKHPDSLEIATEDDAEKLLARTKFDLVLMERPYEKVSTISHVMVLDQSPTTKRYDLVSSYHIKPFRSQGVISITGTGKGKTTTALGYAMKALLQDEKVAIVQWFKERKTGDLTWAINEHQFPQMLTDSSLLEFFPTGLGFFGSPNMDRVKGEQAYQLHRAKAYEGLDVAREQISVDRCHCLVLDELIDTVKEISQNIQYPLIDLGDLTAFLDWVNQQRITVIVTGRRVTPDWQQYISTSIEITEIKHPWSTARLGAVSGLDF